MNQGLARATVRATLYEVIYLSLVSISIALPGAKPFNLNIKFFLAGALLVLLAIYPRSGDSPAQRWPSWRLQGLHFIALGVILAIWSGIAYQHSFNPLPELRSMAAPILILALFHPLRIDPVRFVATVAWSSAVYVCWKLLASFGIYFGVWSYNQFHTLMHGVMGAELVGSPSCLPKFFSLVMVNDLLIAFSPLLLLRADLPRLLCHAVVFLGGIAILATNARYLVVTYYIVLISTFVLLRMRRALTPWTLLAALALGIFSATWGSCLLDRIIGCESCLHSRQSAAKNEADVQPSEKWDVQPSENNVRPSANEYSDSFRHAQFIAMVGVIESHPWLGTGVGSYVRDYVRLPLYPYSYELMLLSYVYKFGLVGMIVLAALAFSYAWRVVGRNILAWGALGLAVAGGIFDPYYESSIFAIVILLIARALPARERLKASSERDYAR